METLTLICEAIGCDRPAAWVRVEDPESRQEDLLCQACWAKFRQFKPQAILWYVPCDRNASSFLPAFNTMHREEDGEDIICIGG